MIADWGLTRGESLQIGNRQSAVLIGVVPRERALSSPTGRGAFFNCRLFIDDCGFQIAGLRIRKFADSLIRRFRVTELLYQTDSYLKEFEATVTAVDAENGRLVLDRTAFYPGGGGQPCDHGTLTCAGVTAPVTRVAKEGDLVWHHTASSLPAEVGQGVKCALDWERRYALMRTHTALHILCGVVWRDYGALVTGGNMEPGAGRMDFEFETLRGELVGEIEAKCNREIVAARDVRVRILPREEAFQIPDLIRTKINLLPEGIREVRTVEIAGLDLQADGGTHVANTREVVRIRVTDYKSKGAINKRIYIAVVER
jgi:misacylated tRNA(Ala) deacylase